MSHARHHTESLLFSDLRDEHVAYQLFESAEVMHLGLNGRILKASGDSYKFLDYFALRLFIRFRRFSEFARNTTSYR